MGIKEDAAEAVKIDPNALDTEWLRQAELYYTWSVTLANLKSTAETCRREIDLAKAEVTTAVLADPASYGLEKSTKDAVEAVVFQSMEYKKAVEAHNEAAYRVQVVGGLLSALDHKKRALENLVDLHLAGYFAQPTGRKGAREAVEEDSKQRNRRAAQKRPARKEKEEE